VGLNGLNHGLCRGVETAASIIVHRVSLSVGIRWLGWTQEHIEDIVMYPGSGYRGPTSSSSSSLYSRAPKSGVTTRVCKRFGRGSLGAIIWFLGGEVAYL